MATWGVALEWTNTENVNGFNKLMQYKQSAAKELDYLLACDKQTVLPLCVALTTTTSLR
jgi:hypothetical protein